LPIGYMTNRCLTSNRRECAITAVGQTRESGGHASLDAVALDRVLSQQLWGSYDAVAG